jgi:hypothetical protein
MIARRLQFFSVALLLASVVTGRTDELQPGNIHRLVFQDVDGNTLSTADGHVTIITVTTRQNEKKARAVASQVPSQYIGDPRYRYVTLVNFQRKVGRSLQGLTKVMIRRRLDAEAKGLKEQYLAKKLTRDPRNDVFVVADFDGEGVTQLGLSPDSNDITVFVFNGEGKLIERWIDIPPGDSLPKAIAAAE